MLIPDFLCVLSFYFPLQTRFSQGHQVSLHRQSGNTQLSADQDHGSTVMGAALCNLLSPHSKDLQNSHQPTAAPLSSWQGKLHSVCHLQVSILAAGQQEGRWYFITESVLAKTHPLKKKKVFESLEKVSVISEATLALVWLNTGFTILSKHSVTDPAS